MPKACSARLGFDTDGRKAADHSTIGRPRELVASVTAKLEAAGKLDDYLAAQALALAHKMTENDSGAGMAALSRELRAVMDTVLANTSVSADPVDELKSRRDAKRRSG